MRQKLSLLTKTMLLLGALMAGSGSAWADEVEFTKSDFGSGQSTYSATKNGVTVNYTGGLSDEIRIYKNNTITISSSDDITSIVFTCTKNGAAQYGPGSFGDGAPDGYTYDSSGPTGTWTGKEKSVSFTASDNQVRATSIVVTIDNKKAIGTFSSISDKSIAKNSSEAFDASTYFTKDTNASSDVTLTVTPGESESDIAYYKNGNIFAVGFGEQEFTITATPTSTDVDNYNSVSQTFTVNVPDTRTVVNVTGVTVTPSTIIVDGTATASATLNVEKPSSATITYESLNTSIATCTAAGVVTAVAKGTATIRATVSIPADDPNYKVGTATATAEVTVNNPHSVIFSVNGKESEPASVEEGETIVFPTNPSALGGKNFVGWTTAPIDGTAHSATLVDKATETMDDSDLIYYAVFADGGETEGWQKMTASSVTEAGVYALLTTDGHAFNGTMDNGHGQVTATAFSFTNDFATSAPTGTCEITFVSVTGGFKWYNAENGYLYAKAASSKNLAWHATESSYWKRSGSNWVYNSNSAYLRSYSNNSFRTYAGTSGSELVFAKKTTISTYDNYCTSITETATVTTAGWATYAPEYAVSFRSGTKAYIIELADETETVLTPVTSVPAGTPVLLEGTKGSEVTHTMDVIASSSTNVSGNYLHVSDGTAKDGIYVLASGKYGVGFYLWTGSSALTAGKIYMQIPSPSRSFISLPDETNGIDAPLTKNKEVKSEVYSLSGQRVAQPTKGLYIVNGKKVIIK